MFLPWYIIREQEGKPKSTGISQVTSNTAQTNYMDKMVTGPWARGWLGPGTGCKLYLHLPISLAIKLVSGGAQMRRELDLFPVSIHAGVKTSPWLHWLTFSILPKFFGYSLPHKTWTPPPPASRPWAQQATASVLLIILYFSSKSGPVLYLSYFWDSNVFSSFSRYVLPVTALCLEWKKGPLTQDLTMLSWPEFSQTFLLASSPSTNTSYTQTRFHLPLSHKTTVSYIPTSD